MSGKALDVKPGTYKTVVVKDFRIPSSTIRTVWTGLPIRTPAEPGRLNMTAMWNLHR